MSRLTYGSLFSGVGGMDLGFDKYFDCVFQVEWDKHCQSILRKHWPSVPKWTDVQEVNGAEVPPCDVLTFGSPCQDLSVAGKRAGLDGGRSSMFYEATRIIKEMRYATRERATGPLPRVVVWENVCGALTSNGGADFGEVLDTLAECGAVDIQWSVLDAQHFGVPQRRRRVFVIAQFDPATAGRSPAMLLPVKESSSRDSKKGKQQKQNVTAETSSSVEDSSGDTVGALTCSDLMKGQTSNQAVSLGLLQVEQTLFAEGSFATYTEDRVSMIRAAGGTQGGGSENIVLEAPYLFDAKRNESIRISEISQTLTQNMGTGGNNVPMLAEPLSYDGYNQKLDDSGIHRTLRIGRDSSDFIAQETFFIDRSAFNQGTNGTYNSTVSNTPVTNTLLASGPHAVGQPNETEIGVAIRRLTPMECERLMGWPDDHTKWTAAGNKQSDSHRYKQCGNGVVAPVAAWIAKHINKLFQTTGETT